MRILIQRVKSASVTIGGQLRSQIGAGLLVLLGVGADDTDEDVEYLAGKLVRLRIFDDAQGVMNLDVRQVWPRRARATARPISRRRPRRFRTRCTNVSRHVSLSFWGGR